MPKKRTPGCVKCGGVLEPEYDAPTCHWHACRACRAEAARRRYHADLDRAHRRYSDWRSTNPDKYREMQVRARVKHAAVLRERARNAYWRDVQRAQTKSRRYFAERPGLSTWYRNRNRASGSYTLADARRMFNRFLGKCAYCGVRPATTVEHVLPVSRGGTNWIGNLLPACGPCNVSKNSRTIMEWRALEGANACPLEKVVRRKERNR